MWIKQIKKAYPNSASLINIPAMFSLHTIHLPGNPWLLFSLRASRELSRFNCKSCRSLRWFSHTCKTHASSMMCILNDLFTFHIVRYKLSINKSQSGIGLQLTINFIIDQSVDCFHDLSISCLVYKIAQQCRSVFPKAQGEITQMSTYSLFCHGGVKIHIWEAGSDNF